MSVWEPSVSRVCRLCCAGQDKLGFAAVTKKPPDLKGFILQGFVSAPRSVRTEGAAPRRPSCTAMPRETRACLWRMREVVPRQGGGPNQANRGSRRWPQLGVSLTPVLAVFGRSMAPHCLDSVFPTISRLLFCGFCHPQRPRLSLGSLVGGPRALADSAEGCPLGSSVSSLPGGAGWPGDGEPQEPRLLQT